MSETKPAPVTLPETIPIFPLAGVLLLPGGKLPLNIFEPRYLDMVRDAMAGERVVGMVQPTDPLHNSHTPEIYQTGCAGRITSFRETDDGRFLIMLNGFCRFEIDRELDATTKYRQVIANWAPYASDICLGQEEGDVDRTRLLPALQAYLKLNSMPADWQAIESAPSNTLVDYLAMICPFEPSEKQALLECPDVCERSRVMTALIEMAIVQKTRGSNDDGGMVPRH